MRKLVTVGLCGMILCLFGCTASEQQGLNQTPDQELLTNAVEEEEIEYSDNDDSKEQRILIDMNGYCPSDKKTVYFVGDEEAGVFYVIDADSKKEVYKGAMILTDYQMQDGELLLKGDFSTLDKEGSYYIEAPYIGRSYKFDVDKEHLTNLYKKLSKALWDNVNDKNADLLYRTQAFSWLLRYWEYYGDAPETAVAGEVPEYVQKLMRGADALISAKPVDKSAQKPDYTKMTEEELSFYCAAMAQFYEILKPYDSRAALVYLREAETVYKQLEAVRYEEDFDGVWLFYDAAVLYKATGYARYSNEVKAYLGKCTEQDFFSVEASEETLLADEAYVHGIIAYLNTVYKVDMDLCGKLMEELTGKAETVAREHDENPLSGVGEYRNNRMLSDRLFVVAIVEHVVVSREYVMILEDGMHYINGCNVDGKDFLTAEGVFDPAHDEKGSGATVGGAYLFILGEIMESEAMK